MHSLLLMETQNNVDLETIVERAVERAVNKAIGNVLKKAGTQAGRAAKLAHIVGPAGRDMVDTHTAVAMTGLSRTSIARLVEEGGFPIPVKIGTAKTSRVLYRRTDIERWVEDRVRENEQKREERRNRLTRT